MTIHDDATEKLECPEIVSINQKRYAFRRSMATRRPKSVANKHEIAPVLRVLKAKTRLPRPYRARIVAKSTAASRVFGAFRQAAI